MNYYSNFIFDLDGTLLNTIGDLENSLNNTLIKYNYPTKTLDEVNSYVGNGIAKLVERSIPNGKNNSDFKNILNDFFEFYSNHLTDYTKPYDNITEMLKNLKNNNCKIAVVSNKSDSFVKILCNYFFKEYIDIAVGETDKIKKKPNKDMVEYTINKLNLNHKDTIYIGDSDVDILTAQNSSLPCISVSWGFRTKEFLIENGAKIIIDNPLEILSYMRK